MSSHNIIKTIDMAVSGEIESPYEPSAPTMFIGDDSEDEEEPPTSPLPESWVVKERKPKFASLEGKNLSSLVRAKLTSDGVEIAQGDDLKVDEEGFVNCSLREFMRTFGPYLWSVDVNLFEGDFDIGPKLIFSSMLGSDLNSGLIHFKHSF